MNLRNFKVQDRMREFEEYSQKVCGTKRKILRSAVQAQS